MPLPAGVQVPDNRANVLLPDGYCSHPREDFPVLYLLHGAGDTWESWAARTDVATFAARDPVIVVMPDGGHNATATWYSDWVSGTYQEETYITSVLPAFVNARYRTRRGDAGIAGLSMGGFGAMSLSARHPGMYRAAASFSGAVDMLLGAPATGKIFAQLHVSDGTPDARVWGDQAADQATWAAHNPASLAGRLRGVPLFLASGTGTKGGPEGDINDSGPYGTEAGVWLMNQSFSRALTAAGVPYLSDFYQGGYHGWPYWQADLHWALPKMMAVLGGAVPTR